MKIGLETESMHLWFQNGRMDIFSYIDFAEELGCDGIIINIIKDFGLDEEWGCLGSNDESHLKKIKEKLDTYGMYCEIDSKGFDKDKFEKIAKVSQLLGVKIIRSYVPLTDKNKKVKNASDGAYDDSKITAKFDKSEFLSTADEIKALIQFHYPNTYYEILLFFLIPISLLLFFYQRYKFHHNYLQEFLFHLLFFFKSTCT